MKQIHCSGTPSEIGYKHGKEAKTEIDRGLVFYEDLFQKTAGLLWPEVCNTAAKFEPLLRREWLRYYEEMEGIAKGANVPYHSILALNVRTEIAYGMSKDGCTALYWKNDSSTFLAQNWDWQEEQQENLISLDISPRNKPAIAMITEAGIIGKIGLNSNGVGVCLNAIRALGVDFGRLPCHLALRAGLECQSVQEAVVALNKSGVASACHILVADPHEAVGLECSHLDIVELATQEGVLTHTNHFIRPHPVDDKLAFKDSPVRLARIDELIQQRRKVIDESTVIKTDHIRSLLSDEQDSPTAICRSKIEDSPVATLFHIVMNLRKRSTEVVVGKPSQQRAEILSLNPVLV